MVRARTGRVTRETAITANLGKKKEHNLGATRPSAKKRRAERDLARYRGGGERTGVAGRDPLGGNLGQPKAEKTAGEPKPSVNKPVKGGLPHKEWVELNGLQKPQETTDPQHQKKKRRTGTT